MNPAAFQPIGSLPTRRDLQNRLEHKSETSLAVALGLPREEVENWPEDEPVPPLREVLEFIERLATDAQDSDDPDAGRIVPPEGA